MSWKRVVGYLIVAIVSCVLTIAVMTVKYADVYMAQQNIEFQELVHVPIESESVEASVSEIVNITSLNAEQKARVHKLMDELIKEQIAE